MVMPDTEPAAKTPAAEGASPDAPAPSVLVERSDGVAWVIINRPTRRNAIDRATRRLLATVFAELDADDEVRVAVLTGAGDASFCAGTDLKEAPLPDERHILAASPSALVAPLESFRKPVIAAVNGTAMGGGFELALAADLRIASTTARFALPEVKIGSLPGSGGTQRLFAAVPAAVASKLLFTGDPIDAAEALRVGLVSDVVEPESLRATVDVIARRIAANAPLSLLAAKACRRAGQAEMASGLAMERTLWALLSTSEDRAEGRAAFREGRAPHYRSR